MILTCSASSSYRYMSTIIVSTLLITVPLMMCCFVTIQDAQPMTRAIRGGTRKQRPIAVNTGHRPPAHQRPRRTVSMLKTIDVQRVHQQTQQQTNTSKCQHIKFALLNARSVCNKTALINEHIIANDFDALFITETWLFENADTVINQLLPTGYLFIKRNRKNRSGGGLIVIYKETLDLKKIKTSTQTHSFEILECSLKTKTVQYNFTLCYRPPTSKKNKYTINEFHDEFHEFMIDLSTKRKNLYILGDFNIHVNDVSDKPARDFLEMIESLNMRQHVDTETHEAGNTLDLLISHRDDNLVENVQVENSHISDHYTVIFDFQLEKPKPQRKTITYRKIKSIDMHQFRSDIVTSNLTTKVENAENVEKKMNVFTETLTNILDQHAPLTKKVVTVRPDSGWFTEEIRLSKQKRRTAEQLWRKTRLEIHKQLYKKAKLETNALINECKHNSIKKKITENKGNSKELFNIMNSLTKNDNSSSLLPSHTEPRELADKFNTYFIDKITTIRSNLENATNTPVLENESKMSPPLTLGEFEPATTDDIAALIRKSPNKQCQLDAIPTSILKACVDEVTPAITSIINRSIQYADFPSCMKEAIITPILKKKNLDKELFKNYRPISNLNFISKLVEKVTVLRLHQYISTNNLHSPYQSAYRPAHSTETALLRIHNDVINELEHHDNVMLLLLDLSAAFDTVDHVILINRMKNVFGITDMALQWFENYLSSRTQRVVLNGTSSSPSRLSFGVPQGSVLGPYLFTIYTQPLDGLISNFSIPHMFFADDTQMYSSASENNAVAVKDNITNCVGNVKSWMASNKLKFNDDKTEYMTLKKKSKPVITEEIEIGEVTIKNASHCRNLGFYFDEHLDMNFHITKVCQTLHGVFKSICRIRHVLDTDTCKLLVHALVTSRLDYCNSLLYGLPQKTLNRLQVMQNKAARIITKTKKSDHITPVLRSLHWLPVEKRIEYKVACLTYSCIHNGNSPQYLKSLVHVHIPQRQLRSSSSLLLERKLSKTNSIERSFTFSAPIVWNSLTAETRNSQTLASFRKNLKTDLFRSAYN